MSVYKKRRDKENVLKKKNEAKKKQKVEAEKEKSKVEVEEKVVAQREKELAEVARVATKLEEKETIDKVVEEERQNKDADDREGDTHTQWTWMSL